MQHSINNGIVERNEAFDLFVENCSEILKGVLDRPNDEGVHLLRSLPEMPRLLYMLAHYADEMTGTVAEKCRSGVASLMAKGVDCSTLGAGLKSSLLLILESWLEGRIEVDDAKHRNAEVLPSRPRHGDHGDLLRALATLTERCTFDAESVRDSNLTPAQLFGSHMDFFARLVTRYPQSSTPENAANVILTRRIISNLMVNNADIAIRVISPKLLRSESAVRTMFLSGALDVLEQSNLDLIANPGKLDREETKPFTRLLLQRDLRLVKTLIQVCTVNESDVLSMAMFRIWERQGSLLLLIKGMLMEEVRMTEAQAQLFRTNSVTTRIVAFYIRTVGFNYLRGLVTPLLDSLHGVDPDTAMNMVGSLSQMVLDDLVRTMDVPSPVRQILGLVSSAAMAKFPEARSQAVAGFFVLRVLCPSIISPERLDLQVQPEHRRTLLQVSKVIMNVANNQYFQAKEPTMLVLNDLIGKNIGPILHAMTELGAHTPTLSTTSGTNEEVHVTNSTDPLAIAADEAYLRFYMSKNDKKEAIFNSVDADNFIPLIELLRRNQTEAPAGVSRQASYDKLMRRRGVRHAKASSWFYEGTSSATGSRLFYFVAGEEDIIYDEAFLKHIVLTLLDVQSWDLIVDLTRFQDQPPANFLEQLFNVCPLSIMKGLGTIALFQANFASFPTLKSIYILATCAELPVESKIIAVSSPSQLMTHIPYARLDLPESSMAVSDVPPQLLYYDMFFEIEDARQIPVSGYYMNGSVVLQSIVKQELVEGLSAELTEVYSLEDVDSRVQSKISGPGASALIKEIKEAKKTQKRTSRPRRRFKGHEPQKLTISVVILCACLYSLLTSEEVLCRIVAFKLLRAANESFAFGLSDRSLQMEDPPLDHVLRIGTTLAKYLPHMSVEMTEELIRLLGYIPSEHRVNFVTLSSAWLGSSLSKSIHDGQLHAERLVMTRSLTRALTELMTIESEDFTWVDPLFQQLGGQSHPDVQEIVLETMVNQAVELGRDSKAIARVTRALDICNPEGITIRLATSLRKDIQATGVNPSSSLTTHGSWKKISCFIEILRARLVRPKTLADVATAIPDLAYSLLMTAGLGTSEVRISHQNLMTATMRAVIAMSNQDDDEKKRMGTAQLAKAHESTLWQLSDMTGKKKRSAHLETLGHVQELWANMIDVLTCFAPNNGELTVA